MSAPPHPDQQDPKRPQASDEGLTILDHMMVFRSSEEPAPLQVSKKMPSKASRTRFKKRVDTPAPPTKGDGRKRLDVSPFPEDKQTCKRLDFGAGSTSTFEDDQICKRLVFGTGNNPITGGREDAEEKPPTEPTFGVEERPRTEDPEKAPKELEHDLRVICFDPSILKENSPDSGQLVAGDEMTAEGEEDNRLVHGSTKDDGSTTSKRILEEEGVNLPEMEIETNPLSKSSMVPCQMSESQDAIAVGYPMQPKHDTILSLASLTAPEDLDNVAAQPLLAGGLPVAVQLSAEAEPVTNYLPSAEPLMEITVTPYGPPLDEFPPLVKGRAMEIRDSFETNLSKLGKDSGWP